MEILNLCSAMLNEAREANRVIMNQAVENRNDPKAPIKMDMLENEIYESTYKASIDPEIHLTYSEKIEHNNTWRTNREKMARLEKNKDKPSQW